MDCSFEDGTSLESAGEQVAKGWPNKVRSTATEKETMVGDSACLSKGGYTHGRCVLRRLGERRREADDEDRRGRGGPQ